MSEYNNNRNILAAWQQRDAQRQSPNPPSTVSLGSDPFDPTAFLPDPQQLVDSTLSDLFEGTLYDDELNDLPTLLNVAAPLNTMRTCVPQSVHSSNSMTTSTMPINILPAQNNMICSNGVYLMASDTSAYLGGNKRGLSPSIAPTTMVLNNNNKRPKLEVMMANPIPNMVMQNAHPSLTQLPPSMEVVHDTRAVSTPKKANNKNGINTSTNHIKALTGVNGAAVCLEAIETALQQASKTSKSSDASCTVVSSLTTDSCSTDAHLSGEEKVKQSRDRNRQHARNTRVRKKAYVEELKRTLNTLAEERDVVLQQKRLEQQGIMDQRDVRFRVVEDFLNLRGRNEADPMRWSIILEDGFTLRLPRADIPGVVCSSGGPADTTNVPSGNGMCQSYPLGTNKKVLIGVQAIMEDSRMVLSLLQSLGASSLSVSYKCDRDSFMMDNASVVLNWEATSCGAVTKGASAEFSIQGTARARFNPLSNKLLALEMTF